MASPHHNRLWSWPQNPSHSIGKIACPISMNVLPLVFLESSRRVLSHHNHAQSLCCKNVCYFHQNPIFFVLSSAFQQSRWEFCRYMANPTDHCAWKDSLQYALPFFPAQVPMFLNQPHKVL